jgi:hypothetical protein
MPISPDAKTPPITESLELFLRDILNPAGSSRSPISMLRVIRFTRNALREYETKVAHAAHDAGATWTEIGEALGISKQAVRHRYGSSTA